jgi:hypothetical protein
MGAARQPQMNEPKTLPFTVEGDLSPLSAVRLWQNAGSTPVGRSKTMISEFLEGPPKIRRIGR